MLKIPGVLPLDVPVEHGTYVTDFSTNKKHNKYSVEDSDFNINSIT